MGEIRPIPTFGEVYADVRGEDRTMRISYHQDRSAVVMSLWFGGACRGTFRMSTDDLDGLISVLTEIRSSAAAGAEPADPASVAPETEASVPVVEPTADGTAKGGLPMLRIA